MSIKKQFIEWSVPIEEVQIGMPVGYEIEFSLKSNYNPILYKLTTYDEVRTDLIGEFFYSLDDGDTWIQFPSGNNGQIFNTAYKIRLIVNIAEFSSIYAENDGVIYRIRGDGSEIISLFDLNTSFEFSDFTINSKNNDLLIHNGSNNISILNSELKRKSNIAENCVDIISDGSRNLLWMIKNDKVVLRTLDTNADIVDFNLVYSVDNEFSSSSSTDSSTSESSFYVTALMTENVIPIVTEADELIIAEEP